VPTTAGRRIAIGAVLLLLAGAGALVALPHRASVVRIGSLSLLWWYAVVIAPLLAVAVTAAALVRGRPPAPPVAPATAATPST
jgi:hypothetical protein